MVKVNTSDLTGIALDYAVAMCEGVIWAAPDRELLGSARGMNYSTDWAQGGSIIERELLLLRPHGLAWECSTGAINWIKGPTPLIASMRCYVASKLGDTVNIPKDQPC